eukprot:330878_1
MLRGFLVVILAVTSAQLFGRLQILKKRIVKKCELFPMVKLSAIEKEYSSTYSAYKDPNEMDTCLFKLNDGAGHNRNTKLSDHFTVNEFISGDNAQYFRISPTLIECLESIRNHAGYLPFKIKSAYRTPHYNKLKKGSSKSYHLSGTAVLIEKPTHATLYKLADIALCQCRPLFKLKGYEIGIGLAIDKKYLHIDMRRKKDKYKRWIIYDGPRLFGMQNPSVVYDKLKWDEHVKTEQKKCTQNDFICDAGRIGCPVKGGCWFSSYFAKKRKIKEYYNYLTHNHLGVDLQASTGTEILAAAPGIIERASNKYDGYGNCIVIKHKDGTKTLYAHLSEYKKKKKDKVKKGDVIGKAGNTGTSAGPHLHFEYWKGKQTDTWPKGRIDPYPCIKRN